MFTHELFVCRCGSIAHQLVISSDEDDWVYATVHLSPERDIFSRIWHAIKYIFGHRSEYGDFDEFIFNPKDYKRLQDVVDKLKSSFEKEESEKQKS